MDDDIDINFSIDGTRTKNYDIDVDWEITNSGATWAINNFVTEYGNDKEKAQAAWNDTQTYLQTTYKGQSSDTFAVYKGQLWYYNASLSKWGYVQNGAGGAKLLEDIKEAAGGSNPDRWQK
jgi:hypothetical protein